MYALISIRETDGEVKTIYRTESQDEVCALVANHAQTTTGFTYSYLVEEDCYAKIR